MKKLLSVLILLIPGIVLAQLNGTKTIGGSNPDYLTLEEAIDSLNYNGVGAGGVIFVIRGGVYYENDSLSIDNLNSSAERPVKFITEAGTKVVINFNISNQSWGIRIYNSDYIKFDGSGALSEQNFQINGNRTNDLDAYFTIFIANGSDNCSFINSIITHQDNSTRNIISYPISINNTLSYPLQARINNTIIENCEIRNGSPYGIFIRGNPSHKIYNTTIRNNKVIDFTRYGIDVYGSAVNLNISKNEVYQIRKGVADVVGITVPQSGFLSVIESNYIHNLNPVNNRDITGIYVTSDSGNNYVYNNIIYLNPDSLSGDVFGIYSQMTSIGIKHFYYNSVYIDGYSRSAYSHCLAVLGNNQNGFLKNNILVNNRTGQSFYHSSLFLFNPQAFIESNNNFLSVMSDFAGDNRYISSLEYILQNSLNDLVNYPLYIPRDTNSLTGNPDLNIPSLFLNPNSPCNGKATPISFITNDFRGAPRDPISPDIGAYEDILTHITSQNYMTLSFQLSQNYPNPFNPKTNISYTLNKSHHTFLRIYDVLGQIVEKLVDRDQPAGSYNIEWDANKYSSGIYFYTIEVNGFSDTKRMLLLK